MKNTEAKSFLKETYAKYGRIRNPIKERIQEENKKQKYKKGYEVRIRIYNEETHSKLIESLEICKIKVGKPYQQGYSKIIPIYGKNQVDWFKKEIIKS